MKHTYDIEYRLDDIENYDATEYSDTYTRKIDAMIFAKRIIKKYGDRVVLCDLKIYDEDGYLEDVINII